MKSTVHPAAFFASLKPIRRRDLRSSYSAEKRELLPQRGLSDADISEIANAYTERYSPNTVEISDEEYDRLITPRKHG